MGAIQRQLGPLIGHDHFKPLWSKRTILFKPLNKRRIDIKTFKKSTTILYPSLLVEVELKRTSKKS
jgi:hypothetical protein